MVANAPELDLSREYIPKGSQEPETRPMTEEVREGMRVQLNKLSLEHFIGAVRMTPSFPGGMSRMIPAGGDALARMGFSEIIFRNMAVDENPLLKPFMGRLKERIDQNLGANIPSGKEQLSDESVEAVAKDAFAAFQDIVLSEINK